jgi:nicotinamidase/pyrazinamidase
MGSNHSSKISPSKPSRRFIIGIIDFQNDFCKGGKLAVAEAEEALAAINKLRYLYDDYVKTFISQDWHDDFHMSFAETHNKTPFTGPENLTLTMEDGSNICVNQMMWPRHCVENTVGSRIHNDLIITRNDFIVKKGTKKNVESYSAFGDEFQGKYEKTQLSSWCKALGVSDIILTGLASDYCVYNTALDAVRLGYKVHLILSCTRGVDKKTTDAAFADLKTKDVLFYKTVDDFHRYYKATIIPQ